MRFKEEDVLRGDLYLPRTIITGMPELAPDTLSTVIEIELEKYKARK
ncbi:MAG: hypothetical protein HQ592_12040 [Planctomycetes bacterium]|nr:hypothetical protein [Planctomycetota bacterium]